MDLQLVAASILASPKVNRRKHLVFEPGEERIAVPPLADALQAVHQVGERLGEVGPQLQRPLRHIAPGS